MILRPVYYSTVVSLCHHYSSQHSAFDVKAGISCPRIDTEPGLSAQVLDSPYGLGYSMMTRETMTLHGKRRVDVQCPSCPSLPYSSKISRKVQQKYRQASSIPALPSSVRVYVVVLPFLSIRTSFRFRSSFSAGYIVPGVGFVPLLFPSSLDICCPLSGFLERSQRIWKESMPRISQQHGILWDIVDSQSDIGHAIVLYVS